MNFVCISKRASCALACAGIGATSAFANLTINPTWGANILSDPNSAAIQSTIGQAISFYNTHFTDNVTVNITFQEGGGLGSSSTQFVAVSYANYRSALATDSSTADDVTALSHLPVQANEPVTGGANIALSTANARALGFAANPASDSTITLNTSLCFLNHTSPSANLYDLYAVACHEIDEALGTVSFVGNTPPSAADLFRYDGFGNRSFTTSTGVHAFFSIDTTTSIVEYNQFGRTGGDWGDWIHHATPQVQDFSGTPGVLIDMGPSETRLLDVVGYNYAPVPEPATIVSVALGGLALLRRRRK